MATQDDFQTPDQLLSLLGERVRTLRLSQNKRIVDIAAASGVAVPAIARLERGMGSSLRTFVCVMSALGQVSQAIDLLAPQPSVSPLALLAHKNKTPKRASHRRE